MQTDQTAAHYTRLHSLETPASRLIRDAIWGRESDIGQQSFITPRYLDDLVARLRIDSTMRILDLGCGVGGPAVYLAETSGAHVSGVDLVEKGVEVARDHAAGAGLSNRTDFRVGDALDMPFGDTVFDVVMSLNVMNVFADKVAVFNEVRRTLRPDGVLAMLSGTFDVALDPESRRLLTRDGTVPIHFDSIEGYREKIEAAGFVIQEVTEYVEDFRIQIRRWRDAYRTHADAIAAEQGEQRVRLHHGYFDTYLRLVDAGRASNHLVLATSDSSEKTRSRL